MHFPMHICATFHTIVTFPRYIYIRITQPIYEMQIEYTFEVNYHSKIYLF